MNLPGALLLMDTNCGLDMAEAMKKMMLFSIGLGLKFYCKWSKVIECQYIVIIIIIIIIIIGYNIIMLHGLNRRVLWIEQLTYQSVLLNRGLMCRTNSLKYSAPQSRRIWCQYNVSLWLQMPPYQHDLSDPLNVSHVEPPLEFTCVIRSQGYLKDFHTCALRLDTAYSKPRSLTVKGIRPILFSTEYFILYLGRGM